MMKDLTQGNPLKQILLFALPLGAGQLFQQFYSLVDVHIVGEILGETSLAAVGATTPLSDFLIGFLNGFCNGFAIVVAICFGSNKEQNLKKAVAASFGTGAILALVLSAICLLFLQPILSLMRIDQLLVPQSTSYIRVIILGLVFSVAYNTCAAILRGIGDTITPLLFLVLSAILNIGLDYFFILGLHTGVYGAALATVLSQLISFLLCLFRIARKYPILHVKRSDFRYDKEISSMILSTGFSMGLMISLVNLGTLTLQSAINSLGSYIIVAHTAARKATSLLMLPMSICGSAMATFAGQNLGAGKYDRIRQGCHQSMLLVELINILLCICCWLFGREIIALICASTNDEVLRNGSTYLQIDTIFYFLTTGVCIIRNTLQGMGYSKMTIISSFCELITKLIIALSLAPAIGYTGIIWCEPIAWFVMLIPLLIMWIKVIRLQNQEQHPI